MSHSGPADNHNDQRRTQDNDAHGQGVYTREDDLLKRERNNGRNERCNVDSLEGRDDGDDGGVRGGVSGGVSGGARGKEGFGISFGQGFQNVIDLGRKIETRSGKLFDENHKIGYFENAKPLPHYEESLPRYANPSIPVKKYISANFDKPYFPAESAQPCQHRSTSH